MVGCHWLRRRQTPPEGNRPGDNNSSTSGGNSTGQTVSIIVVVVAAIFVTALVALYVYLRRQRSKGHSPKFIPRFMRKKLESWHPVGKYSSVDLSERGDSSTDARTEHGGAASATAGDATSTAAGVDRNTSVRSVMTLPAYSSAPKETEQVIGREGERGGMDTVVEFPETGEEEEAARETEMESLYNIRQARRREIAEREERRRERREARDRGDTRRLEELRQESRQRTLAAQNGSTGNLTADLLIAEHNSRPKERRVSSVAYGDVGQVRHDGTRLRTNSHESERGGLLDEAAPMGEGNHDRTNSDATSLMTLDNLSRPSLPFAGGRQRSGSGALSISTISSFDMPQATPATTDEGGHRTSDGSEHQRSASASDESPGAIRATPPGTDGDSDGNEAIDPRIVSMIRDSDNDIARPPEYEHHEWGDAPAYEAEMRRRESQRSARLGVPTINVQMPSEPNSPYLTRVSEDRE